MQYTVIGFYEDGGQRFAEVVDALTPAHAEVAVATNVGATVVAVVEGAPRIEDSYATYIGSDEAHACVVRFNKIRAGLGA